MGIMDNAVHIGTETPASYGVAVTPTRSFEAQADSFKRENQYLESVGFRAGMETLRGDRRKVRNMGGAASLEMDMLDKGFGMLLAGCLGTASGPTQVGASPAYVSTFTSDADEPPVSWTMQMLRAAVDGSSHTFTHSGVTATGFSLGQDLDDFLKLAIELDFQNVVTDVAEATPAYPVDSTPFDWAECLVTIGGVEYDSLQCSFEAELATKTDRRYLRRSELKKRPVRNAMPSYSGSIEADFEDLTRYAEFAAGTITDIQVNWRGAPIDGTEFAEVTLTLPAVQWEGESPESSLTDLTKQELPYRVLDNGSDAAVTLEIKSTDSAL